MSEVKAPTRSEREAKIKDKAGLVIVIIALFLAGNTYIANKFSSTAQTNLIKSSNTYNFYQAKSMKQSIAEGQLEEALNRGDRKRAAELETKIARYESDPKSGEGKKELLELAKKQEAARAEAQLHSPWLTFSGMLYQLAIVLLSASILAVNMRLFWASIVAFGTGLLMMSQGVWLWLPLVI